jgi:hypothetical protein
MKIRFSWGTGIFIFLTLFIVGVVVFYLFITKLDIRLVEDNYYEKELAYQQKINKIDNTRLLSGKIGIERMPGMIMLRFPSLESGHKPEGSVVFYRPSDPDKDFSAELQLNDSLQQVFDISKIDKGKWIIKIDWKMGGKEYYFEESVIVE